MENYGTTMKLCCSEAINAACERRGIDISRIEVFDGFSPPLPILTTDTSSLGGKHLRITGKIHIFNILIFPETSAYWLGKKRTFRGIESCKFLSIFIELGIGFLNCLVIIASEIIQRRRYYQKYDIYEYLFIIGDRDIRDLWKRRTSFESPTNPLKLSRKFTR